MQADVERAIAQDRTIDITTTGRRSGRPRRIEIWWAQLDGRSFITGRPGRRDWYANLQADPRLTVHLKRSARADLPGVARLVTDADERAQRLRAVLPQLGVTPGPEDLAGSPLVEVSLEAREPLRTALAFLHALEAADFGALRALCTDDFAFPGLADDLEAFLAVEAGLHGAFSEVGYAPEPIGVEGDVAVVRIHLSGRHSGPFQGIAATGRRFALPAQDARYHVRDGRVTRAELAPTAGAGVDGILAQLR